MHYIQYPKHILIVQNLWQNFDHKFRAKFLPHRIYLWYNFVLKYIVTKCLNFSLTMWVFWHSQKCAFFRQCSNSNKNMIADFIYKQVSRNLNFAIFVSTNSTIKSWIMMKARLSTEIVPVSQWMFHVAWSNIIWLSILLSRKT